MFSGKGSQLTIYIGESDLHQHQSLYMAIVKMLRRKGLSGATVTRGVAGFGMSSVIHTSAILRLSMDMPMVITVVDRPERIKRILAPLIELAPNSLITVHDVEVVHYGNRGARGPARRQGRRSDASRGRHGAASQSAYRGRRAAARQAVQRGAGGRRAAAGGRNGERQRLAGARRNVRHAELKARR